MSLRNGHGQYVPSIAAYFAVFLAPDQMIYQTPNPRFWFRAEKPLKCAGCSMTHMLFVDMNLPRVFDYSITRVFQDFCLSQGMKWSVLEFFIIGCVISHVRLGPGDTTWKWYCEILWHFLDSDIYHKIYYANVQRHEQAGWSQGGAHELIRLQYNMSNVY